MNLDPPPIRSFQDELVPPGTRLVGASALARAFSIRAPVRHPSCVAGQHVSGSRRQDGLWTVFDKRYWPGDDLANHLEFILRHEDADLLVLKRIFEAAPSADLAAFVRASPGARHARRIWFLYEALTGRTLDVEDAPRTPAVDLLDGATYYTGRARLSKRHRVRDNLLGTPRFAPMIRRTDRLERMRALDLGATARDTVGRTGASLIARAASFMLLADSRASFEIEGERPARTRLERWGRAVVQAGTHTLSLDELIRLHRVLIEDTRFVQAGLRLNGVFVGERDHLGDPLPEFIGARAQDLADLIGGLLDANDRMRDDGLDPVLQAAATAFAFVYVHPFEDGNGRLHRCLVHHVLAERRFTPLGMVFPVSSVMLDRIDEYRATLQGHSRPLMPFIEWRPTPERNVDVLNDTADLYRYFDCTDAAEFLYGCVQRTVDEDLPREIDYLRRRDDAIRRIMEVVEMPDRLAENLLLFIRQNDGTLPRSRREGAFNQLRDDEVHAVERIVADAFTGFHETPSQRGPVPTNG
jgi:hypothetical protein